MIKSRTMRRAWCVPCVGEMRCAYRVLVGKHEEEDHLEDLGVDGRIIFKWIFRKRWGMKWIDLTQDRDRWRAVVNAEMNFRFP
jgi:hypothetical protein